MSGFSKGFYVMNRRYPRDCFLPEILLGLYHPQGGCRAELAIRWHDLGHRGRLEARLEIFADAWPLWFSLPELRGLAELPQPVSQEAVVDFLLKIGFRDLTDERSSP